MVTMITLKQDCRPYSAGQRVAIQNDEYAAELVRDGIGEDPGPFNPGADYGIKPAANYQTKPMKPKGMAR